MGKITKIPNASDIAQARESSRTLAKYADQDRVTMTITSKDNSREDVVLPGSVMELLLQMLTEISRGNAINLMPLHAELTTQEVANLMNVSRPFVVKLLESGEIPHHKVGSHRRVLLVNLIEFMKANDHAREEALDELTELSQSLGVY